MKHIKGIEINPKIMFGKPVIAGTRIPVEIILEKLEAGQATGEILKDYPNLSEEDIKAALAFANKLVKRVTNGEYAQAVPHKISR